MTAITDALIGARFLDKGGAVFNVKHPDFGAVGDGVVDDTPAIQATIDALPANGGEVLIPTATFHIASTLKIPINTVIRGTGAGSILAYSGTGNALLLDSTTGLVKVFQTRLENFAITTVNTGANGVKMLDVAEVVMSGVEIVGTGGGFTSAAVDISATSPNGASIVIFLQGCTFRTNQNGIRFSSGANRNNQITIIGCRIQGNLGTAGIWAEQQVKGLTIIGNDIEGNTGHQIRMNNGGENLAIISNWMETNDGAAHGIGLLGTNVWRGVVIQNNHMKNNFGPSTGDGITLNPVMFGARVNANWLNQWNIGLNVLSAVNDSDLSGNSFQGCTTDISTLPVTSNGVIIAPNKRVSPTYGTTVTPLPLEGDIQLITVTDSVAFTIANVTGTEGQRIFFDIFNNTGGAIGALTWSSNYKLGAAWTQPAAATHRTIEFLYNAAKWIEVSRVSADIAD